MILSAFPTGNTVKLGPELLDLQTSASLKEGGQAGCQVVSREVDLSDLLAFASPLASMEFANLGSTVNLRCRVY